GGAELFVKAATGLVTAMEPPCPRASAQPIGRHNLQDHAIAIGLGLAFGHTSADALERLMAAAQHAQASGARTAPDRSILITGVEPARAAALVSTAHDLGFVTMPDDPRLHIVACSGKPHCASGEMATRTLAPAIAKAMGSALGGSTVIHLSG